MAWNQGGRARARARARARDRVKGSRSLTSLQRTCPDWKDARSIVGMLRVCNYSVEDCTSAYMAINDDGE